VYLFPPTVPCVAAPPIFGSCAFLVVDVFVFATPLLVVLYVGVRSAVSLMRWSFFVYGGLAPAPVPLFLDHPDPNNLLRFFSDFLPALTFPNQAAVPPHLQTYDTLPTLSRTSLAFSLTLAD